MIRFCEETEVELQVCSFTRSAEAWTESEKAKSLGRAAQEAKEQGTGTACLIKHTFCSSWAGKCHPVMHRRVPSLRHVRGCLQRSRYFSAPRLGIERANITGNVSQPLLQLCLCLRKYKTTKGPGHADDVREEDALERDLYRSLHENSVLIPISLCLSPI